jgi:hypothetical protein
MQMKLKYLALVIFASLGSSISNNAQLPIEIKGGKGYFAEPHYLFYPDLGWDDRLEYNPLAYGKIINGNATWF